MEEKEKNFFNIKNLEQGLTRALVEGITTRIFMGEQAMLSVVSVQPNAVGSIHSHPEEQWGILLEGSATRIQNGEEILVQKGDFWRTPGGTKHGVIGGPEGALILDVFSPPRESYKQPGNGFGSE